MGVENTGVEDGAAKRKKMSSGRGCASVYQRSGAGGAACGWSVAGGRALLTLRAGVFPFVEDLENPVWSGVKRAR